MKATRSVVFRVLDLVSKMKNSAAMAASFLGNVEFITNGVYET